MQQQSRSPKLKTIQIIHLALLAGMVLYVAIVFFLKQSTAVKFDKDDVFAFIVPVVAIMGAFASYFLFGKALPQAQRQPSAQGKLVIYQTALIMRYAFLEGPALFATTVYFLTGNFLFLAIAIAIIAYFTTLRPTKEKLTNDLSLNYDDQQLLF
ncbi:ATP synthase F0 subunit C [Mucilaginibacter pallidiroseus]|uniref:ATP synthase F0 subunit C n=1 Tax=Mucilaginibacter pallidiroseus TaxID=2599295 RepID=A0A563UJP0_9SPHI|nr:ATP synthase F0 subunit C [Mucilaginibacter pallidiroseus]TWR31592.1 ATP synthase F0 subunit C [Mucilaginibacter pallidiroseus]